MKCRVRILLGILLFPVTVSWSQDTFMPQSVLLTNKVERTLRLNNLPEATDTAQISRIIKAGNRIITVHPDSAAGHFVQALRLSWQLNYDQGIAVALLSLGSYFFSYANDYERAKVYYNKAVPYCERSVAKDPRLLPGAYSSIANVYFAEGKHDSALHFYYKVLETIKARPVIDTPQLVRFYAGLAAVMGSMAQNDRALHYFRIADQWWQHYRKDSSELAMIYRNSGSLHYKNGNIDSGLWYYNKSLQLYQTLQFNRDVQNMYNYIATIWLYEKKLENARLYLDSAIRADIKGVEDNWELLQNLGCVHYFSGEFEEAATYYQRSLKLYNENGGLKLHKLNIYETLAAIYDTLGQGRLAYHYQVAYAKLKDTLFNENKIKTVNQLEVQYRTSEKDKELAQKQLMIAQQHNKIQQQYLWIGGAVLAIFMLLGVFYRKRNKATIAQLKAILAGEEKERLRMAAELHDGIVSKLSSVKMNFDALAPAYAYTPEENTEFKEALQLLEQSIAELRTTSQNLQPSILKKAGLTAAVAIYCEKISKVALPLAMDFQLVGELPPLNEDFQLNIYRIIQELVNNMVKHSKATRALVQFNAGPRQLNITVEDNGIGLPHEKLNSANGIGLFNLQKRLKLLNGTMDIATQNGTSIYLEFDLHSFIVKST